MLQLIQSEMIKQKIAEIDDKKTFTILNLVLMENQIPLSSCQMNYGFLGWLKNNYLNARCRPDF